MQGRRTKVRAVCRHLTYVAQDFAQYNGRGDGRGLQPGQWDQSKLDIVSDITAIPEPDESFDAIHVYRSLRASSRSVAAIIEFRRLLIPGGLLLLTAPFCSLTHFARTTSPADSTDISTSTICRSTGSILWNWRPTGISSSIWLRRFGVFLT